MADFLATVTTSLLSGIDIVYRAALSVRWSSVVFSFVYVSNSGDSPLVPRAGHFPNLKLFNSMHSSPRKFAFYDCGQHERVAVGLRKLHSDSRTDRLSESKYKPL